MNGPGAAPSRLLLGVCGLLLAAAGTEAGYLSWRVHGLKKTLAQASGQSQELEHTREAMSRRWEELQGKYEQLLRDHGSLAEEKSNLVAALTHTQAQLERHRQLAAERDVLEASLKKVGEESAETLLAAKDGDKLHLVRETADLWFHCLVMLAWHGLGPDDVLAELRRREGISGIDEKQSRDKD